MEQKQCTGICGKVKDIDQFNFRAARKKLFGQCKECRAARDKQYNEDHKKEKLEYDKQYREEHKKEKKQYKQDHKDEIAEYQTQYQKEYRKTHKAEKAEYEKQRYAEDPEFRLRKLVSKFIREALKANGYSKAGQSTFDHLPYSPDQLIQYLESLFEPWMNWKNHGAYNPLTYDQNPTWNLDHIKPQSNYNFTSIDCQDIKDCWALENLRPYSAKQNVSDGDNRKEEQIQQIKEDIKNKLEHIIHSLSK